MSLHSIAIEPTKEGDAENGLITFLAELCKTDENQRSSPFTETSECNTSKCTAASSSFLCGVSRCFGHFPSEGKAADDNPLGDGFRNGTLVLLFLLQRRKTQLLQKSTPALSNPPPGTGEHNTDHGVTANCIRGVFSPIAGHIKSSFSHVRPQCTEIPLMMKYIQASMWVKVGSGSRPKQRAREFGNNNVLVDSQYP